MRVATALGTVQVTPTSEQTATPVLLIHGAGSWVGTGKKPQIFYPKTTTTPARWMFRPSVIPIMDQTAIMGR